VSRQRIPKLSVFDDGVFKAGLGWMVTDTGDNEIAILFQCPNSHRATIGRHSIDHEGYVNASVLCYANCGYHEFVILDDWPSHWSKPAGEPFVEGVRSEDLS
jgi:hypothetical protein